MNNNIKSITNKLWAMANELRGTMDASEYKNYILAFMFYRYLSEHQEEYLLKNNVIDVIEGESINESYNSQVDESELEDYLQDISASLGYAIAPKDTWQSLIDKINDSQVIPSDYQTIFDNFNKNAELNKEAVKDFRGVFNDINLGDSRLGSSTNERAKSLNNIVKLVDSIEYKGNDGKDILGEIYEYLIGQFAASAGKKGGEFYTPHQVSKILAKVVTEGVEKSDELFNVYDPTMGSGSLLLTVGQELPKGTPMKYFGQELNTTTYNLARMNLMMHGISYNNMVLSNADTLESDWPDGPDAKGIDHPRSFDAVVANPPYSAKWDNDETKLKDPRFSEYGKLAPASKADYAFILHSIYHLNKTGTMAIVLPHGVLFRGAAEGKIREILIGKNYLDTIIGLPANLFYGTSIPTVILVLKKNRENKDILFIDASNDFEKNKNQNNLRDEDIDKIIKTYKERKDVEKYAHLASIEEIRENDFNLNIPRYVDTFEEEEPIDLEEINKLLEQDNKEIAELEAEINEQLKILGVKI
ncbi:type I restriction-modification system subunit M [Clostridium sporogenes]|uniref:type I restriction-modification system subunit M n=1 Tax=Clostridium TaxID=1485 RepID=UPI000DFB15EC|nr:type I restriction-modification system subunit M [Clostridium sporogenes]STC79512.1 type I restriction-modification system, M subunit [Clostridium botulinum]MCF4017441.1 type I restriction-modification system subunit M [Clostridium sporogenes]MCW6059664.1 type I restriction-modification system subunit M [Clostridium sporogenes]MCW6069168.1 type I restriction-modification system subunit M [Clostridium sporogenes]MCW6084185.1 type I restriction-modification system subunit M [Clostridium sporo